METKKLSYESFIEYLGNIFGWKSKRVYKENSSEKWDGRDCCSFSRLNNLEAGRYESVSFHDRGIKRHGISSRDTVHPPPLPFFSLATPLFFPPLPSRGWTSCERRSRLSTREEMLNSIDFRLFENIIQKKNLRNLKIDIQSLTSIWRNSSSRCRGRDNFLCCRDGNEEEEEEEEKEV